MSLKLDTDVVLDVARAANPDRVRRALEKLNVGEDEYSAHVDSDAVMVSSRTALQASTTPLQAVAKSPEQEFQAFVMRSLLEQMMPKSLKHAYGGGFAGEVYRSQMIDAIAHQVAGTNRDLFKLGVGLSRSESAT